MATCTHFSFIMISKSEIKNFQSHKKLPLVFSKGLNVIWGDSDTGKSAIIRALRWAIESRPLNNRFIRKGTKEAIVRLFVGKHTIERRKGKVNTYKLDDKPSYKAIRADVPVDIQEALGLSSINVQSQDEIYFLIDKKPSEVGKILNEVSGLELVSDVLKETNQQIRQVSSQINERHKKVESLKRKIYDLDWIDRAKRQISILIDLEEKVIYLEEEIRNLENCIDLVKECQRKIKLIGKVDEIRLQKLLKLRDEIKEFENFILHLSSFVNEYQKIKKALLQIVVLSPNKLKSIAISYDKLVEHKIEPLSIAIDQYIKIKRKYDAIFEELDILERKFKKLLKGKKICPVCGQKIKK